MDLDKFEVKPEYFDHPSWLHGVNHTCRVMSMVWAMGSDLGMVHERNLALCAAYIHDMARTGDGICYQHGPEAAEKKFPLFKSFFIDQGIDQDGLETIRTAVRYHSLPEEIDRDHPHYKVTALLKDADALDRIRLGFFNLDKRFLRFPETHNYISQAKKLFRRTSLHSHYGFLPALEILESITGKSYPRC